MIVGGIRVPTSAHHYADHYDDHWLAFESTISVTFVWVAIRFILLLLICSQLQFMSSSDRLIRRRSVPSVLSYTRHCVGEHSLFLLQICVNNYWMHANNAFDAKFGPQDLKIYLRTDANALSVLCLSANQTQQTLFNAFVSFNLLPFSHRLWPQCQSLAINGGPKHWTNASLDS